MSNILSTLKKFKKLNVKEFPRDEVIKIFREFKSFGMMEHILHPEKDVIIRARANYNSERFFNKSDYSYKPARFNTTYQRASTPNQTMMYGCILSDAEKNVNPRITGALETLDCLRSIRTKRLQVISFGKWEPIEPLHLVMVLPEAYLSKRTAYNNEMVDIFEKFKATNLPEFVKHSLAITNFLSKHFKRWNANAKHSYRYLLSAIFSEIVANNNYDGVVYPSVRVKGRCLNVAIKPEAVDNKMKLSIAGEVTIYKKYFRTFGNNETMSELSASQTSFPLTPITDPSLHKSEAECLQIVGAKGLKEINKDCRNFNENYFDWLLQLIFYNLKEKKA